MKKITYLSCLLSMAFMGAPLYASSPSSLGEVSDPALNEALVKASEVYKQTQPTFDLGAEKLITDAAQFSSNAKEPNEGSFEALLDGDNTTFFHSQWSNGWDALLPHNLCVNLVDNHELTHFAVKYQARLNNGDITNNGGFQNLPTDIKVYGGVYDKSTGEYSYEAEPFVELFAESGAEANENQNGIGGRSGQFSLNTNGKVYQSFKFEVIDTYYAGQSKTFFSYGEFQMYEETVSEPVLKATQEQIDNLKKAIDDANQAGATSDVAALISALNSAVDAIVGESAKLVSVTPDPLAGQLESVPATITLNFDKEIKSVDEVVILLGPGMVLPLESNQCVLNGKQLTLNLPVAEIGNISGFSVSVQVTDVNGKHVTYGEEADYISFMYDVAVPANTYLCSQITPAAGEVTSLKDFDLTFVNEDAFMGDNIGGVDESKAVILRDSYGTAVARGTITVDYDNFSSVAHISLSQEVTAPGTYTLSVKEGTIYNSGYNADQPDLGVSNFSAIYNPELNYVYTIAGDKVIVDPNPTDTVLAQIPEKVTMTFAKEISGVYQAMIGLGMGQMLSLDPSQIEVKGNTVTFNLPVESMGKSPFFSIIAMVLDVEGNTITFGDYEEDYVYVEYEVAVPANRFECQEITPAEGDVNSLKEFELLFVNASSPWGDNIGGLHNANSIVLKNAAGEEVAKGTASFDPEGWSPIVKIVLDQEIAQAGTYTLVVPEGVVYNSGYNEAEEDLGVSKFDAIYNPELTFNFTVVLPTGIEEVVAGNGEVKVYNLNGVLVAKSLKNLPKGVYVVNGKKVIVK